MARVTVEDCLENVDNRFQLIMVASKRARQLAMSGQDPHVAWENDKPTVVALREIAEGYIDASILDHTATSAEELEEQEELEREQAAAKALKKLDESAKSDGSE